MLDNIIKNISENKYNFNKCTIFNMGTDKGLLFYRGESNSITSYIYVLFDMIPIFRFIQLFIIMHFVYISNVDISSLQYNSFSYLLTFAHIKIIM